MSYFLRSESVLLPQLSCFVFVSILSLSLLRYLSPLLFLSPSICVFSSSSHFFFLLSFLVSCHFWFCLALMYVILTLQLPFTQILFALPLINDPPDSWNASSLIGLRSVFCYHKSLTTSEHTASSPYHFR